MGVGPGDFGGPFQPCDSCLVPIFTELQSHFPTAAHIDLLPVSVFLKDLQLAQD